MAGIECVAFGCKRKLCVLPFDREKQGFSFDKSDKGIGDQNPGLYLALSLGLVKGPELLRKNVFTAVSVSIGLNFKFTPTGGLWTNSRPLLAGTVHT
jgi:hypothetical protein